MELRLPIPIPVSGDVKVEFFHQINRIRKVDNSDTCL